MNKNNVIDWNRIMKSDLSSEEVQAEVDALYDEMEQRWGAGYADSIIRRYTNVKPRQRGDQT